MSAKTTAIRKISRDEILAYASFYDFYNESELELEKSILTKAQKIENTDELFQLLLYKENSILKWKGALRIKRYFEDEGYWKSSRKNEFLNETKKSCNNRNVNREIVKKMVEYKGISYPIASTIVYFFSNGNCPIIDWRAIKTLKEFNYNVKDDDWDGYFNTCLEIVNDFKISFRDLDKALWIYQDIKKYTNICKKLNDLKII